MCGSEVDQPDWKASHAKAPRIFIDQANCSGFIFFDVGIADRRIGRRGHAVHDQLRARQPVIARRSRGERTACRGGRVFNRHAAAVTSGALASISVPYEFSGKSALRKVALEIPISPAKGLSSSRTRKIAPANDSAHIKRAAITTRSTRANRVKLTKIALSQKTRMIRNGTGIEPPACANNSSRVCAPSVKAATARDCSERCESLLGVRRSSSFSNADAWALNSK